ncbi:DUF3040 domain-containing protein [Longimycelium tulufanense]|nr:DUF3040 domain-containing protein [Longimycelium tulufanense]
MLSRYEKHQLEQIERWLQEDDPELARDLREGLPGFGWRLGRRLSWTFLVMAVLSFFLGIMVSNGAAVLFGMIGVGAAVGLLGFLGGRLGPPPVS